MRWSMNNICLQCETWKNKQKELLQSCDSIFDACSKMEDFEKDCIRTCPYKKEIVDNSTN